MPNTQNKMRHCDAIGVLRMPEERSGCELYHSREGSAQQVCHLILDQTELNFPGLCLNRKVQGNREQGRSGHGHLRKDTTARRLPAVIEMAPSIMRRLGLVGTSHSLPCLL